MIRSTNTYWNHSHTLKSDFFSLKLIFLFNYFSAWLITTLVVLLIYLCTRCCDTKSTKHRKSRPIRCILSFFALVTAAGQLLQLFVMFTFFRHQLFVYNFWFFPLKIDFTEKVLSRNQILNGIVSVKSISRNFSAVCLQFFLQD